MPVIHSFLLHVLMERGRIDNLYDLAEELELHYESARRGVIGLERRGLVKIDRGTRRGVPMKIYPVTLGGCEDV